MTLPKVIALIPARAGSKRIPGKNIRQLADHPVMAYTISSALDCGIFDAVVVSTDSEEYAQVARHYGAEVPFLRPVGLASDSSPDIEWVEFTLNRLRETGRTFGAMSILRPTSPFRQAETIRRAWSAFSREAGVDSLRAIEKCRQHPGKMWTLNGTRMTPLLRSEVRGTPSHSSPTQFLPQVYVQNASLEIAWTRLVFERHSIAGDEVMPFLTQDNEGFDLNDSDDWLLAEQLVNTGHAQLPPVSRPPWPGQGR